MVHDLNGALETVMNFAMTASTGGLGTRRWAHWFTINNCLKVSRCPTNPLRKVARSRFGRGADHENKKYIRGVAPWLLLGPLTGPLAEGIIRNWRAGEIPLAWLYGIALWLTSFDLYHFGGQLIIIMAKFHA